jgi:hypothetical protein
VSAQRCAGVHLQQWAGETKAIGAQTNLIHRAGGGVCDGVGVFANGEIHGDDVADLLTSPAELHQAAVITAESGLIMPAAACSFGGEINGCGE